MAVCLKPYKTNRCQRLKSRHELLNLKDACMDGLRSAGAFRKETASPSGAHGGAAGPGALWRNFRWGSGVDTSDPPDLGKEGTLRICEVMGFEATLWPEGGIRASGRFERTSGRTLIGQCLQGAGFGESASCRAANRNHMLKFTCMFCYTSETSWQVVEMRQSTRPGEVT